MRAITEAVIPSAEMPLWQIVVAVALGGVVGVGAIVLHVYLTRRNPVWLGAIIPATACVCWALWLGYRPTGPGQVVGWALTLAVL